MSEPFKTANVVLNTKELGLIGMALGRLGIFFLQTGQKAVSVEVQNLTLKIIAIIREADPDRALRTDLRMGWRPEGPNG